MKGLQSTLHISTEVLLQRKNGYQNNSNSNCCTYLLCARPHGTIVCCLRSVVSFSIKYLDHQIKPVPENTST